MTKELHECRYCGGEYLDGLFRAHLLVAHQPKGLDPDRLVMCRQCQGRYPKSQRPSHDASLAHREHVMLTLEFDAITVAEAYERGDRIRDIEAAFPMVSTVAIYRAVRAAGVPLRGIREGLENTVAQRDFLARTRGDQWRAIRRLRDQGSSWLDIESIIGA